MSHYPIDRRGRWVHIRHPERTYRVDSVAIRSVKLFGQWHHDVIEYYQEGTPEVLYYRIVDDFDIEFNRKE